MAQLGNFAGFRQGLGNIPRAVLCAAIVVGAMLLGGSDALAAAPIVDSFTASSASVLPGGNVALTVTAHDPDCASSCATGCGAYLRADLTSWSASGGSFVAQNNGVSGSPYTATATWSAPAATGTYTITVSLADSGTFMCGGRQTVSASVDVLVTTSSNRPPTISSLTAARQALFPGGSTSIVVEASDPDGDPLTFHWSATVGSITPGAAATAVFDAPTLPGPATITCTVSDPSGASATASVVVSVTEALPERALAAGLRAPVRVAVTSLGEAVVLDRGAGGLVFVGMFSGTLNDVWPAANAVAVAVDWDDRIVVAEPTVVGVYDRSGQPVAALALPTSLGTVSDVAVDPTARRYAVLFGAMSRVAVFGSDGRELFEAGEAGNGPGQLKDPSAVTFTDGGDIVIGDRGHGLVHVFSGVTGAHLREFAGVGGNPGQLTQLYGVGATLDGAVLISDSYQSRISSFSAATGTLRETFGDFGEGLGRLKTPAGVAVSPRFSRLLVASTNTSRVEVFRLGSSPAGSRILAVSTGALHFPGQVVGSSSGGSAVTLTSVGSDAVGLDSLVASGDFRIASSACGSLLAPGQSCSVTIAFSPTAPGSRLGALTVRSNAEQNPATVGLDGLGVAPPVPVALTITPTSVDFGVVRVGSTSGEVTVSVRNDGAAPVLPGPLVIGGVDPGDFALVADGCSSASLPVGASCSFSVTFAPGTAAFRSGQVSLLAGARTVALSGSGTDRGGVAGIPAISGVGMALLALLIALGGVALRRNGGIG